jgi:hypothetical protein
LSQAEEHEHGALDEAVQEELQDGQVPERGTEGNGCGIQGADRVADHHDVLAVPAVDEHAGREAKYQVRQAIQRPGNPGIGGRARQVENKQRESDALDAAAELGDCLTGP